MSETFDFPKVANVKTLINKIIALLRNYDINAKENMLKLMLTLMEMEEEQKHMTEEEKERNAIGFTCEDGKFVYF